MPWLRGRSWAGMLGFLGWLGALALGVVLWREQSQPPIWGLVTADLRMLAPAREGVVAEIGVRPGDRVRVGQVLLRLRDDGQAERLLALEQREVAVVTRQREQIAALQARAALETEAARAAARRDTVRERQFTLDRNRQMSDLAAARREQAAVRAELTLVAVECDRLQALAATGLIAEATLLDLRRARVRLGAQDHRWREEVAIRAAVRTVRPPADAEPADVGATARAAWLTQEQASVAATTAIELSLIADERSRLLQDQEALIIRSPATGVIQDLHSAVGAIASPRESSLTLCADGQVEIVAWLPEALADRIPALTTPVTIRPACCRGPAIPGRIAAIGPTCTPIDPALVSLAPTVPRGLPLRIRPLGPPPLPGMRTRIEILIPR